MIQDEWRYFAPGGSIRPNGPSTWYILDWDQRRIISVTMDERQESEDLAIEHLKKHINHLAPDVQAIHVSAEGDLLSTSTDPWDDHTPCVHYPSIEELNSLEFSIGYIPRSDLLEVDRLTPNVDHVTYEASLTSRKKTHVIFKYYFLQQFMFNIWNEMNIWMRLPRHHPNIVPFDKVILEEINGNVVGFTTFFIPGGTLSENKTRVFRLKHLEQLMQVVDDFNLKYGLVHQDIAPRNLLMDPKTDNLLLFDFNYSGRIGDFNYEPERNDVKGVIFTVYEIITNDERFREVPHTEQDESVVENMDEWVQHPDVKLDHPVSEYRAALNAWVKRRREAKQLTIYTEAPEYIDWSYEMETPMRDMTFPTPGGGKPQTVRLAAWSISRREMKEKGEPFVNWERPPQVSLSPGTQVVSDGTVLNASETQPDQ